MASQPKIAKKDGVDANEPIQKIYELQSEIERLNEEASEEILTVEQKFNKQRMPIYRKRNDIITQIPKFWSTAIMNHPLFASFITENDRAILDYLKKVEVEEFEDIKSGYKVSFHFESNPYFENQVLTKEFHLCDPSKTNQNTTIKWKEGKDPAAKSAGRGRKRGPDMQDSFFLWFSTNDSVVDDIGEQMKDELWTNPLQFYLGPPGDDDDEFDEEDDNGVDYDEEDGDGEEGDFDEEDELDGEGDEDGNGDA